MSRLALCCSRTVRKWGHFSSSLHPPLSTCSTLLLCRPLICSPQTLFLSLFVLLPREAEQRGPESDEVTGRQLFLTFFHLPFLSDHVCDCVTLGSLIDRGRGGVCLCVQEGGRVTTCLCACLSGRFEGGLWEFLRLKWVRKGGGLMVGRNSWGERVWGWREGFGGGGGVINSFSHPLHDSLKVSHLAGSAFVCLLASIKFPRESALSLSSRTHLTVGHHSSQNQSWDGHIHRLTAGSRSTDAGYTPHQRDSL